MRLELTPDMSVMSGAVGAWFRQLEQRVENAAVLASDEGAKVLVDTIRADMKAAGLGTLGQAITYTSDRKRGNLRRFAGGGFSASGFVYVRTRNERTIGALISYTQGAHIRPRKGRWLWFPTDEIQRYVGIPGGKGKQRLTPALWSQRGLDKRIGPLVLMRSINGNPMLIVKNVGVDLSGRKRSARSLTKRGLPRKGQMAREMIVAFIGIPFTSRQARIDVRARYREEMSRLPARLRDALGKV